MAVVDSAPTVEGVMMMADTKPFQQREGTVARTIEEQTAKLPSDVFLWAAIGSMGVSLPRGLVSA